MNALNGETEAAEEWIVDRKYLPKNYLKYITNVSKNNNIEKEFKSQKNKKKRKTKVRRINTEFTIFFPQELEEKRTMTGREENKRKK